MAAANEVDVKNSSGAIKQQWRRFLGLFAPSPLSSGRKFIAEGLHVSLFVICLRMFLSLRYRHLLAFLRLSGSSEAISMAGVAGKWLMTQLAAYNNMSEETKNCDLRKTIILLLLNIPY